MMLNSIKKFEREARVAKALGNQMEYRQALKKIESRAINDEMGRKILGSLKTSQIFKKLFDKISNP